MSPVLAKAAAKRRMPPGTPPILPAFSQIHAHAAPRAMIISAHTAAWPACRTSSRSACTRAIASTTMAGHRKFTSTEDSPSTCRLCKIFFFVKR